MSSFNKIVDFTTLTEMLFGEEKYITEFAEAAIISFTEFKENYALYLMERDEVNFRKVGHKITPVAQMLGLNMILEEYKNAKNLIRNENSDYEISKSLQKTNAILDQVLIELNEINANGQR